MKTLPVETENNVLKLLCTYLLYERGEETELRVAFLALVQERHLNFHVPDGKNSNGEVTQARGTEFVDCTNEICVNARRILAGARDQAVMIGPLVAQIIDQYGIVYTPEPGAIRARLLRKSDRIEHLVDPGNAGKLVIASS